MQNLLLYSKYVNVSKYINEYENIYCFNNNKIVAVDELSYDKYNRLKLQKTLGIRPYYLSQKVFKETLYYIFKNPHEMNLRNVEFVDSYIEDSFEYKDLKDMILNHNIKEAYTQIYNIIEEFDTEIYEIKIRFMNFNFTLTKDGVLEVDAPEDILNNLICDKKFNNLLLGLS